MHHVRFNNVPDEEAWETRFEAQLAAAGRKRGFPPEGLIGAHLFRARHSDSDGTDEGEGPLGPGSECAPSALAAARERERHRIEHAIRRTTAVTRRDLDDAAREADLRVVSHEVRARR